VSALSGCSRMLKLLLQPLLNGNADIQGRAA